VDNSQPLAFGFLSAPPAAEGSTAARALRPPEPLGGRLDHRHPATRCRQDTPHHSRQPL